MALGSLKGDGGFEQEPPKRWFQLGELGSTPHGEIVLDKVRPKGRRVVAGGRSGELRLSQRGLTSSSPHLNPRPAEPLSLL